MDDDPAATLRRVGDAFRTDLPGVFGHGDVEVAVGPAEVVVVGSAGSARVSWPFCVEAEGPLGAHARIVLELLMASEAPTEFWPQYRPPPPHRRRVFFDAMRGYLDEVFGGNRFFLPLTVEERGPALLVYNDGEYALVADDGHHRGDGVLHWKVKRLVAYALTDAMT